MSKKVPLTAATARSPFSPDRITSVNGARPVTEPPSATSTDSVDSSRSAVSTLPSFQPPSSSRENVVRSRPGATRRSEEHTSELQSRGHLVCRLLLEKKEQKEHERN